MRTRPFHPSGFIEPALATLRTKVPSGAGFVHELKFDGYRVQAHLQDGRATLYTRSGFDWTNRFPTIAADAVAARCKYLACWNGYSLACGHVSAQSIADIVKTQAET